jgi:hypothetical protein
MDDRPPLFMVEVYRSATEPAGMESGVGGGEPVLGVIEIPGDEVALYLVAVSDAAAAERVVVSRGQRPIRVVDVRWRLDGLDRNGSGKHPMDEAATSPTVPSDKAAADQMRRGDDREKEGDRR